jgi:Zn-dependent protease
MLEAFRLGGWGMFPTLLAGIFTIAAAVNFARFQERARLLSVGILSMLTLVCGGLGFVTGLMVTLRYASERSDAGSLIAAGTFESLNNVALALVCLAVTGVICAVGVRRAR